MKRKQENPFWDSSLSVEERIEYLLGEMELEEKFAFLSTRHPALERLEIPAFSFGGEAAHGVEARNDQGNVREPDITTSFSQPIGMSASWDRELIEKAGNVVGREARALYNRRKEGGLSRWAPTVDMERDPRWGRTEEGYGEDPLLTGEMASAYIRGMQGKNENCLQMAASIKHFYANNVEEGRVWKSSSIDPRNKQEYYLEPFRRAVMEGHAEGLMTAYNEINGVPALLNHEVKELVKEKWGLKGHVVCDGGDMVQTVQFHHYFKSHAQTVAEALKAGVDCFTDDPDTVREAVREAYREHLITEQDIDNALKNTFSTKFRLGLYEKEDPYHTLGEEDIATKEAAALSLKMVQESGVLLKNEEDFLPLQKTDEVVLIGPVGDAWFQDWYGGEPPCKVSLKEGMEKLLGRKVAFEKGLPQIRLRQGASYMGLDGKGRLVLTEEQEKSITLEVNDWGHGRMTLYVTETGKYVTLRQDGFLGADKDAAFGWFVKEVFRLEEKEGKIRIFGWDGCGIVAEEGLCAGKKEEASVFTLELVRDGMAEAVKLAGSKEKVIVALGCHPMINSKEEIDRTDLSLPPFQEKLVQKVYEANPDTALVLLTNYPYSICWEQEHLPGILQIATGSQEMGKGAADLLFGEANPAGRLPLTWYRSEADLPDMDDYDIIKGQRTYQYFKGSPLYPFGYGLSYTSFAYEKFAVSRQGEALRVSMELKNTGKSMGDEVVQIYGKRLSSSRIQHPIRRLVGFERIKGIMPGETRKVELIIPVRELEVYDVIKGRKILEQGEYLFTLGEDKCACPLWLEGEQTSVRRSLSLTWADHYDDYENIVLGQEGGGSCYAAAGSKGEKGILIYRDFEWTGRETHLTLCLRSVEKGAVRVLALSEEKQKRSCEIAFWQGEQKDFARVSLSLTIGGRTEAQKILRLELEGGVELESFVFEAKEKAEEKTFSDKIEKIPYGGDYNPEQWPEEVWKEDMRLFKLAGIDCVTLNVFSWAALQPSEEQYDFERLDRIMETVRANGLKVIMATSTAVHPAWMAKRYPEVLRTDFAGRKRKFGDRHNSCPNSPVFQKYSARLAGKLACRYQNYENIIAWHVSNEYGGECYCENCEKAFQKWLKDKYKTLEELNRVWNTSFWGHTFYDWEEIPAPNLLSEHFEENRTTFQGISLDYRRFFSDSLLNAYRMEYEEIKKYTPEIPVTTNMMGFYKPLDYQKWANYLDFASWDNYPANEAPPSVAAMNHDLMRGLKQGAPFALMEQTPSVTNWLSYNALKRPGVMRLWSYQAVAHGSDSVLFFQMRRSIGACEKLHGAVIDHVGHEYTRVFREVKALGKELKKLGSQILGTRVKAHAAILVDWDNWWALEYSAGPSRDLKYLDEVQRYYDAFYEKNIPVDVISLSDSLEGYALVIAPVLYMVKEGYAQKLEAFVKEGGCLVTTFFSGIVDEHDLVWEGGYPGKLRELLGIWVEETDALPPGKKNSFRWRGRSYECELLCDILYTKKAKALAHYEKDFYAGAPVLTQNRYGGGSAYYVASRGDQNFYRDFIGTLAGEAGIKPVWEEIPGVEVCERQNSSHRYLFFLNHGEEAVKITALEGGRSLLEGVNYGSGERFLVEPKDVVILQIS